MTKEELLVEVDDLLRVMPQNLRYDSQEVLEWLGRAAALVGLWKPTEGAMFGTFQTQMLLGVTNAAAFAAEGNVKTLLYQMRSQLTLLTRGPLNTVVGRGLVFDYFDEVRKIIEIARLEVFFVDPYMHAEFVSRYLPHVNGAAKVRILTRKGLDTLMPAVRLFRQQEGREVEVRAAKEFHDRFVFIDGKAGYQSGASFKDGARNAPTNLMQVIDALPAMMEIYEQMWSEGTPQS